MDRINKLNLIGFASGIAANNCDCGLGPWYFYYHPYLFSKLDYNVHWQKIIKASSLFSQEKVVDLLHQTLVSLGKVVYQMAVDQKPFCVIGGDHSCAIGTWSAVAYAYKPYDIGLIWIDAHMDSHTSDTSITQNIHGMPVAHLLGEGYAEFTQLFDLESKIKPHNICLIGIRSFEKGEAARLARLGVKIYYMSEVKQRGIDTVLNEACEYVCKSTYGFGISIDLDAIDPIDAPGVGCPESGGIEGSALVNALNQLSPNKPLLGLEIAEYNPLRDENQKTAQLAVDLIHATIK